MKTYTLKVFRGLPGQQYWETFTLPLQESTNIISSLMHIQKYPVNSEGKSVAPIVWEDGCLEEVCGSCSMLINGFPRQACTALINHLKPGASPIEVTLAPLTKFPLIRDLLIDRAAFFENLKKIRGWVETDDYRDIGFGPKISQKKQELIYALSTCMSCGCCSEACPQVNAHSKFIGPAALAQAELFNLHPAAEFTKEKRVNILMEEGGVADCGNAQNCARVCPKHIPLVDAIGAASRAVTLQSFKNWLQ